MYNSHCKKSVPAWKQRCDSIWEDMTEVCVDYGPKYFSAFLHEMLVRMASQ